MTSSASARAATTARTKCSSGTTKRAPASVWVTHPRATCSADGVDGDGERASPIRTVARCPSGTATTAPAGASGGSGASGRPVRASGREKATATGRAERFSSSTKGVAPPPATAAYTRWAMSPLGTPITVSTTGAPSRRCCRQLGSIDGTCQRSSAATHQSSGGDPSPGTSAPHGVTAARQGEPSVPITIPPVTAGRRGAPVRIGMSVPYRDARSMRLVGVAVLVPVKDFRQAKLRLAGTLAPYEREALARTMASTVVAAARPLPVFVVCDDDGVAAWAEGAGATVLWRPGLGLNGAVTDGVLSLGAVGVERVIVAHSDLPLALRLDWVAALPGLTLVPDRRDDGTNVACVPTGVGFTFAYGPGSFRRHAAEGRRLGLPVRVVREPSLGWDVDVPDDLAHPALEEALTWLRTNPVSRA